MVCDRCNAPFHLRCTSLHHLPPTYWYCDACRCHIHARGIACATKDIPLQQFLRSGKAPAPLLDAFRAQAKALTFTDQLYAWRHTQWLPYPAAGTQLLILEEVHVQHQHVGGEKLFHLLAQHFYWPTLRADCTTYVQRCFEC